MNNEYQVIPAILTDTLNDFKNQLETVEKFASCAQIDIMDNKFVHNFSFDINLTNAKLKKEIKTKLPLELHLMVEHPLEYLQKWQGVKKVFRVIFHIESKDNPKKVIEQIKKLGWQTGIAINPKTPVFKIKPHLNEIDLILFMTVVPGKQGQKFLPGIGEKIKTLKAISLPRFLRGYKLKASPVIAVDGGINETNILKAKKWGVEIFDVGSAISKAPDPKIAFQKLEKMIKK